MLINLISFGLKINMVELVAKTKCAEHGNIASIHKDECPEFWAQHPELSSKPLHFSISSNDSECFGESYSVPIDLTRNRRLTKHILNQRLYTYFSQRTYVGFDFIDNIEVYIENPEQATPRATDYLRFSVIPKEKTISDGWELLVSFNGHSLVYNAPISQLDLPTDSFRVLADGEVIKYRTLPANKKQDISHIFPIINKQLSKELNIDEHYEKVTNRYTTTLKLIRQFIEEHLPVGDIADIIRIRSNQLIEIPENRIDSVPKGSNVLLFANNNVSFDPFSGLFGSNRAPGYGPYQPTDKNSVKFFFIAHEADKSVCINLYNIFTTGTRNNSTTQYQEFKPIADTIKQPFNTDRGGSIFFTSTQTAIQEIKTQLASKPLEVNTQYVAIYISPVSKDDVNNPSYDIYFKIKEILLQKKITSQVIYKDNPNKTAFKYHLPNIATAILAKIGGIPWQLQSIRHTSDLIIGVGAFKSEKIGKRYIGSAFCFNDDGRFKNFDCYKDDDLDRIVEDIRKALGAFILENTFADRIIIHYYKTMSKKHSKKITDMLMRLNYNIPVYIVTINKTEASDYVGFDTHHPGCMPISGTYVKLGYNEFLLYNNSRYGNDGKWEYLFPVKVKLAKINSSPDKDKQVLLMEEVRELLSQVYKFSRMYWKSVKQQNLPITIKYPEMVAEIVPHFEDDYLPEFGKRNLWFL